MKKHLLLVLLFGSIFSCVQEDDSMLVEPEPQDEIYILPIVVHVVHAGEQVGHGYNLSLERIESQIETLNNDFRKKEGTLGHNTSPISNDAQIEFKLAQFDPDGNPINGINRIDHHDIEIVADHTYLPFDWLPQYGYWNPDNYINIWVLPSEPNLFLGSSTIPQTDLAGLDEELKTVGDGILINTIHFGYSNIDGGANLGRTLTHEVGHFLGLEHLWGKIENADCLDYDDYLEDTPPVSRRTGNCNSEALNCNGNVSLTCNYMDYTSDACMNMFTNDQITRMRYVLENAIRRKSLTISKSIDRKND